MQRLAVVVAAIRLLTSTAIAQPSSTETTLTDLKLDISTMQGKTVVVTGFLQIMGDIVMLKGEPMDMSPIFVSVGQLSRNDRKSLLTTCSIICKATVTGTVEKVSFGLLGIKALILNNVVGGDFNVF